MKRELSGGITSRKRFAGKSDFSVKQVSTTLLLLLLCLLLPTTLKAVTTTIDFGPAATAAQFTADNPGNSNYNCTVTMGEDYSPIGNGAKKGVIINWKNSKTNSTDISRVAFLLNTNGVGNADNTGAGFYLRRNSSLSSRPAGLYTGSSGNKLAVLGLKPGNKVTISLAAGSVKYVQSVHADEGQGDLYNYNGATLNLTNPITINSLGDLIIEATQGTYIKSITIEEEIATYTIQTNSSDNSTEFWFTAPGSLEVNDFAIPYMSVSFGSAKDYLVVQGSSPNDCAAHMFQTTGQYAGTETLSTDANTNWQPSAGNFYAFRPTGGGKVEVSGSLTGSKTHLFVYDPAKNNGNGGWEGNYPTFYSETYTSGSFNFNVEKDKVYYICIDNGENSGEHSNAFHLHWFKFTPTFRLDALAKVVDLDKDVENGSIKLTKIYGYGNRTNITVKRCTANIDETTVNARIVSNNDGSGYLTIDKPTFASGTDKAGTIILDVETGGGDAAFVVTFPYNADYNMDETTGRSQGHTWNFLDTRLSDSNIKNCKIRQTDGTYTTGTNTGILSIGQYKDTNSQFRKETDNREWTEGWVIKDLQGNITDPMYKNVFDMVGDNADMIWETEGLWFDTGTNLSCLYNENDNPTYYKIENNQRVETDPAQPTEFRYTSIDPDRYVGLLPDANGASSFTIPGLKDGDRVLIFMKSSAKSGSDREAIFLNIEGAGDAIGTPINSSDLYGAGGAIWAEHERYEGCYHFVKIGDGNMKFTMKRGAICKLMYIHIYSGKRLDTDHIERGGNSPLLFLNDEGTAQENAAGGYYNLHYRGKGENIKAQVLVQSGNLTNDGLEAATGTFSTDKFWYFKDSKTIRPANYDKNYIQFKSTVGEFGTFRLRLMDMDFIHDNGAQTGLSGQGYKYVCDFADRNFTVGYREKKSYPYTWDFTDMMGFSSSDIAAENTNYPETTNKYERKGWDISLWDKDGYMLIGNEYDANNDGDIFSQNKNGFGNQLYANDKIIPETQGLWFYMDDNNPVHNRCMQITNKGLHFVNQNLDDNHNPWWNYKMVVPSVPSGAAVYLRMKRDPRIEETDKKYSEKDNVNVLFLNTRFHFGTSSETNPKTSLTEDTQDVYATTKNEGNYAFFKVPGTEDEYILVVKNTGAEDHLTFTLNGWIVKKLSVSEDFKKVNKFGWATESRDHVIDQALTTELTGNTFETYVVTGADYASKTVTIEKVETSKKVMKKASEGGNQAYIIRNMDMDDSMKDANGKDAPGLVKILDDGFHLFVPDMHDFIKDRQGNQKSEKDMAGSKMKALLGPQTLNKKGEGNIYNYVLTTTVNQVGMDVEKPLNDVGFYRVKNGSSSAGNQGYLPVDCTVPTGTTDGGGAKMSLVFVSSDDSYENVETAIEVPFEVVSGSNNAVYYNLNGQKMSGKPAKGGLYIMNGKKILVK